MKDFNDFKLLKDLNQKFNLNIEDTEVTKINLSFKSIGKNNEIIKYVQKLILII